MQRELETRLASIFLITAEDESQVSEYRMMEVDSQIENLKSDIVQDRNFDPLAIFRMIDEEKKGFISARDLE